MNITEEDKIEVLKKDAMIKLALVEQILRCINIAFERGAFKASEMTIIGTLHDNLSNGLNSAYKQHLESKEKLNPIEEETD